MSKNIPNDPVISLMEMRGVDVSIDNEDTYDKIYRELNYHLPSFYFSVRPNHYPETNNHISNKNDRDLYLKLLQKGYQHDDVSSALEGLQKKKKEARRENQSDKLIAINLIYNSEDPEGSEVLEQLRGKPKVNFFYPRFYWHGLNNQYHKWAKSMFNNGFGVSIVDGKTAISKVKKSLTWTLSITMVDFIISTLLGLYIGIFLSKNINGRGQRIVSQVLYFLYSLPVFWFATIMVVYFTTDDYGWWTNWFPSVAIDIYPGKSTIMQILLNAEKLILPVLILTLHSLAYSSRFMQRSLRDEMSKPYAALAYSKGLTKNEVIKNHLMKNAMIPMITIFAGAFATAFAGSLVLEVIFNIPGMGRLLINSIEYGDWNVVFCITMVLALVTIISFLVADILYAMFNPKIEFKKTAN